MHKTMPHFYPSYILKGGKHTRERKKKHFLCSLNTETGLTNSNRNILLHQSRNEPISPLFGHTFKKRARVDFSRKLIDLSNSTDLCS